MEVVMRGLLPEALMLGVPHIDAQHEGIFFRIESLKAACLNTHTLPADLAEELLVYLDWHFQTEEAAAREADLEFSEHGIKHQETLAALTQGVHLVLAGRRDVFSLLRYLEIWFERHIVEEDKPLGNSLLAREKPPAA